MWAANVVLGFVHSSPAVSALAWLPLALDPSIGSALGWSGVVYLKAKLWRA